MIKRIYLPVDENTICIMNHITDIVHIKPTAFILDPFVDQQLPVRTDINPFVEIIILIMQTFVIKILIVFQFIPSAYLLRITGICTNAARIEVVFFSADKILRTGDHITHMIKIVPFAIPIKPFLTIYRSIRSDILPCGFSLQYALMPALSYNQTSVIIQHPTSGILIISKQLTGLHIRILAPVTSEVIPFAANILPFRSCNSVRTEIIPGSLTIQIFTLVPAVSPVPAVAVKMILFVIRDSKPAVMHYPVFIRISKIACTVNKISGLTVIEVIPFTVYFFPADISCSVWTDITPVSFIEVFFNNLGIFRVFFGIDIFFLVKSMFATIYPLILFHVTVTVEVIKFTGYLLPPVN